MQPRRSKVNSRAGQRGAVMVEGLIVVLLLSVFFAAAIFIAECHTKKLAALAAATAQGWQTAVRGCGNVQGKFDINRVLATRTDPQVPDPAFLGANQVHQESVDTSVTIPALLGGGSQPMGISLNVTCNEIPLSGEDALSQIDAFGWAAKGAVHAAGL